ncbi:MAG: protein-L-isoaspartate O-methyltransferase, partial [Methylococcaceae bacterium]|nr:protein-L-isoaspartate O-methyltransferase [Methylococcaceae bacterium]
MIRDIEANVLMTRHQLGKTALDPRVMDAMRQVPREEFVPPESRGEAFHDGPVYIGYGQTI